MPRLRMSGAIPLLPASTFMTWTEKTLFSWAIETKEFAKNTLAPMCLVLINEE